MIDETEVIAAIERVHRTLPGGSKVTVVIRAENERPRIFSNDNLYEVAELVLLEHAADRHLARTRRRRRRLQT